MRGTPKRQLSLLCQVIPPSELQWQMAPVPYPYGLDVTSVLRALKRERIRLFLLDQTCPARCSNRICEIWLDTIYSSISFDDLLITHITHNKEPWFLLQYHISYKAVEVQEAKLHKEEKEWVNLPIEEETEKERKETAEKGWQKRETVWMRMLVSWSNILGFFKNPQDLCKSTVMMIFYMGGVLLFYYHVS